MNHCAMAKTSKTTKTTKRRVKKTAKPLRPVAKREPARLGFFVRLRRRAVRIVLGVVALGLIWILAYTVLPVPTTPYMMSEGRVSDGVDYQWVPLEDIAPVLARSVVAAEDANFCEHWGFDLGAIRAAIDEGAGRGASTISQQVVKNAFLWHGRSWPRKALEALVTPIVELTWSKRRILEVYLNIAEFDEGVFGAEAAARTYFGVGPEELTNRQAAQLAAVLPAPKLRNAGNPGPFVKRRAAQIVDGAATIRADGRSACFED
jgi:monofunctional biosynthetic peptidoglycan transglycosylase